MNTQTSDTPGNVLTVADSATIVARLIGPGFANDVAARMEYDWRTQ